MTEKSYGGSTGIKKENQIVRKVEQAVKIPEKEKKSEAKTIKSSNHNYENYRKAGKIAAQVCDFAKTIIKPQTKLLEIAEKTEAKIIELGGKPAFPINLSINETAAHDTPSWNDERIASGLLKVDLGVSVGGCVCDVAFSLDLEKSEENKKLIQAAESALASAIKIIKKGLEIAQIGKTIQEEITSQGFSPIRNLSGHEIKEYDLHAGLTIPNFDNNNANKLPEGIYAIEPFATSGAGIVYDGRASGIYKLQEPRQPRDNFDRTVLSFIAEEYSTLPFCSRWLVKKFGSRSLLSLSRMEQAGILHQYAQLLDKAHGKVSQAETTLIVSDKVEALA